MEANKLSRPGTLFLTTVGADDATFNGSGPLGAPLVAPLGVPLGVPLGAPLGAPLGTIFFVGGDGAFAEMDGGFGNDATPLGALIFGGLRSTFGGGGAWDKNDFDLATL